MSSTDLTVSKALAAEACWRSGNLTYKLHKAQREMRDAFYASQSMKFVINSSRQLGKSFCLCSLALEYALRTPDTQIKFVAPTQRMVKRILIPNMNKIMLDIPEDLRPRWHAQEMRYIFPNQSVIDIAGADAGNADSLRGSRAHLAIVDEAGFVGDLSNLLTSVLLPMLITTNGRILIASTPATVPNHPFERLAIQAQREGAYIRRTVHDNPMLSEKRIAEYCAEAGGPNSESWRREYLAEFIYDPKAVVVPEFTEELQKDVVKDVRRPSHFDAYTSMDTGGQDLTVALFGYWDFINTRLVVEDEFVPVTNRTDLIATGIRAKELELWGQQKPYFRVIDAPIIQITDLSQLHALDFVATDKDDKMAQINELRVMLMAQRIVISPKCATLISHLRGAIWDGSRKNIFARAEGFGHFDAVDALLYMMRNVRRNRNPYPANTYIDPEKFYNSRNSSKSGTAKVLELVFKPKISRNN